MPLTNCPVCEGKISASAARCPHCGHPVWRHNLGKRLKTIWMRSRRVIKGLAMGLFLLWLITIADTIIGTMHPISFTDDSVQRLIQDFVSKQGQGYFIRSGGLSTKFFGMSAHAHIVFADGAEYEVTLSRPLNFYPGFLTLTKLRKLNGDSDES